MFLSVKLQKARRVREQIIAEEEQERLVLATPTDESEWNGRGRESNHHPRNTPQGGVPNTSKMSSQPINSLLPEKVRDVFKSAVTMLDTVVNCVL